MANKSLSQKTGARDVGIVDASSFNQSTVYNNQGYNTFNHSRPHFTTERFAEIKPFMFQNTKGADVVRLNFTGSTQSLAADNPFMSKIYKQMAAFQVPISAIMPRTWNYLDVRPSYGDDVPTNAYCSFNLSSLFNAFVERGRSLPQGISMRELVIFVSSYLSIFGEDQLLRNSGVFLPIKTQFLYETLVDYIQNHTSYHQLPLVDYDFSVARDLAYKLINGVVTPDVFLSLSPADGFVQSVEHYFIDVFNSTELAWVINTFGDRPVSLSRIAAYQLVCAQYYTNDKIDYLHSAKEFLDNLDALGSSASHPSFEINGQKIFYDCLSLRFIEILIWHLNNYSSFDSSIENVYYFFINLFGYRQSMRIGDYFSSSRKRPLAPGDVTANVASNKVSAIDVNKALWMQRFLNSVNRASSDVYKYLKDIFGAEPINKIPMPYELVTETSLVGTTQTANTSDDQGNLVSRFAAEGRGGIYDAYIDQESVIVCLSSYFAQDVPYSSATDKILLDVTREQKFNPFMQHIGDQAIETLEIGFVPGENTNFGYQSRFAEYKFSLPSMSGAFLSSLRSWILHDNYPLVSSPDESYGNVYHLDSDFIRNQNTCMDGVFSINSTVGSEYFHFICKYDLACQINSKMQKNDDIL